MINNKYILSLLVLFSINGSILHSQQWVETDLTSLLKKNDISDIAFKDTTAWILSNGLFIYNGYDLDKYNITEYSIGDLSSYKSSVSYDMYDNILTTKDAVFIFNTYDDYVIVIKDSKVYNNKFPKEWILDVKADKSGTIWVLTRSKINEKYKRLYYFNSLEFIKNELVGLANEYYLSNLTFFNDQKYLIGSRSYKDSLQQVLLKIDDNYSASIGYYLMKGRENQVFETDSIVYILDTYANLYKLYPDNLKYIGKITEKPLGYFDFVLLNDDIYIANFGPGFLKKLNLTTLQISNVIKNPYEGNIILLGTEHIRLKTDGKYLYYIDHRLHVLKDF